ncbi:nuclear transport factor 2 family protein [Qipengyuania flava]|uniref:nuclear transport factor 2 family protein n=1 Tax=Qipengyuania flava TaxID=192812 RepID=UPI001C628E53|nr:nuclear transport factor 2 family protein [Qipengyuania flava]QYJ06629.1 nuclear transport factor 2 family protein [Qipengyuania flava]
MLRALFQNRNLRKARIAAVREMVDALNALDYARMRTLLTPDAVIIDTQGRKMEGIEAIIEGDRIFREQADRPQVEVQSLDYTRGEVLARCWMKSHMPEIDGPLLWRIEFAGERVHRVEVTRPVNRLTAPQVAAQQQVR